MLADVENSFLRSIQIGNELDDHRKGDGNGDNRQRSAGPTHASVVPHGRKRKRSDYEEAQPDCTRNPAPQRRLYPGRVEVDHLIERLDE